MKTPPFSRAEANRLVVEVLVPALRKAQHGPGAVEDARWLGIARNIRLAPSRHAAVKTSGEYAAASCKDALAQTAAELLKAAEENKLGQVNSALQSLADTGRGEDKRQFLFLYTYAHALDSDRFPTVAELGAIMQRIGPDYFPPPDAPPPIPADSTVRFWLRDFRLPYERDKGGRPPEKRKRKTRKQKDATAF